MGNGDVNWIAGFIWGIADDVLRDVYVRGKYRDVILPMTVIRRLDAVLEDTKQAVLKLSKQLDSAGVANKNAALCQTSGNAFFNVSPFTLRDLRARAKGHQLKSDFEFYLDGFCPYVLEILDMF
ncbi:MAG: type I restriction-modification system subunit M N-terminal domain-containing protein, partial [Pseudomonadota bacterium]